MLHDGSWFPSVASHNEIPQYLSDILQTKWPAASKNDD